MDTWPRAALLNKIMAALYPIPVILSRKKKQQKGNSGYAFIQAICEATDPANYGKQSHYRLSIIDLAVGGAG
jgi:hypothetical protein